LRDAKLSFKDDWKRAHVTVNPDEVVALGLGAAVQVRSFLVLLLYCLL
jgi:hypothetical protein